MSKIIKQLAIKRNDPRVRRISASFVVNERRPRPRGAKRGRGQAATTTTTTRSQARRRKSSRGETMGRTRGFRRRSTSELGEKLCCRVFPSTHFSIDDDVYSIISSRLSPSIQRKTDISLQFCRFSSLCLFAETFICFNAIPAHLHGTLSTLCTFSNVARVTYIRT